jgi:hypothetical protein
VTELSISVLFTWPTKSLSKLASRELLLFRPGKRTHKAGKPYDPFLVTHKSRPVDMFIISETELEILFYCFKVAIKLKVHKLYNQVDLVAGFQASPEGI